MFWFLNYNLVCTTTELDDIHFHTVLSNGFMRHCSPAITPVHYHLCHELFFVTQGQCTFRCGEQDYTCTQSDILLINAGTRHNILQLSQDALLYSLQFSFSPSKQTPSFYSNLLSRLSSPVLLQGQETLLTTLNLLRKEFALQESSYGTAISSLLQLFYIQLLRSLLDAPAPTLPQPFSITPPAVRDQPFDVVPQTYYKAILDSFFNSLPLQEASFAALSGRLRLSPVQTRRIVKKYYGVSFQKRLLQAKMEKSQFLMANTDLSLKAIAEQSGYSAYHTFYEAFTSHFGQTPSQYRETCEKK